MNLTTSFEEFAASSTVLDLTLYAGVGIVLWVLFKDKLSPVQSFLIDLINQVKGNFKPGIVDTVKKEGPDDVFFRLVESWKKTRDLAEESGCDRAIEVADEMFPYLSPKVCNSEETNE